MPGDSALHPTFHHPFASFCQACCRLPHPVVKRRSLIRPFAIAFIPLLLSGPQNLYEAGAINRQCFLPRVFSECVPMHGGYTVSMPVASPVDGNGMAAEGRGDEAGVVCCLVYGVGGSLLKHGAYQAVLCLFIGTPMPTTR